MNVELLETFLDVLESRNFNRSSDRLGVAQSSVSARIAALEKSLQTPLFERGRQGAMPTAAGLRLEEHARIMLASWYHAKRDVGQDKSNAGTLRLAGQLSLLKSILVEWVLQLKLDNANRAIDLQADYSNQIVNDLLTGILDIGLLYSPRNLPDLVIQQEGEQTFQMVSTHAQSLQQVRSDAYIKSGYTQFFIRSHDELLPHLSYELMSVGNEELSVELLNRLGGSTYLSSDRAKRLLNEYPSIRFVHDAPLITQPVYSAIHIRRRHDPSLVQALSQLRNVLAISNLNQAHEA